MAVLTCFELWDQRAGSLETGGKGNEGIQHRFTREFQVFTDDPLDDGKVVLAWREIPNIHDKYKSGNDNDPYVLCIKITPKQEADDRTHWKVLCEYSSRTSNPKNETHGGAPGQAPKGPKDSKEKANPTDRPAKLSYSYQRWLRVIEKDLDGKVLCNSVEEKFDPPLEVDDILPVIKITRVEKDFLAGEPINQAAVNSGAFLGNPPGSVRQISVEEEEFYENGVRYHAVTRSFLVRKNPPWNPLPLLEWGYRELVGGKPAIIKIQAKDGTWHQPSGPVPIKDGKQAKEPGVQKYRVYPVLDFNLFGQANAQDRMREALRGR